MKWKMQKEYVNEYIKGNVISFPVDKQAKHILMKPSHLSDHICIDNNCRRPHLHSTAQ